MTVKELITEGTRVTLQGTRVTEGTKPSGEKYVRVSRGTVKKPSIIQQFIKPKDISPKALEEKKILLRKWQKKDLPKWVTDFMGDPLKLSGRERKLVLPFYGKSSSDALQQKQAMTSYLNYVAKEVKSNPAKVVLFAALPPAFKQAGRSIQALGITRLITKVPHGQLIARGTINTISAALGVVYSADVYTRVTAPVFTGYKDGKSTETKKTFPNGDIEITTTTEQTPQYRKPTGPEQHERIGGIFATELAPLAISHRIVNRGVKKGYKPEPKPKTKVKVTTVIKRAGKVIKTTAVTKPIKTVKKVVKEKFTTAKGLVKSRRSKRITGLYIQIQAKQRLITLEKTPAKKAELIKDLKKLENKITREVAKTSPKQSGILKRLLRDERAEVTILTYKPKSKILDYIPERQIAPKTKPKRRVSVIERTKTQLELELNLQSILDFKTAKKLGIVRDIHTPVKTTIKANTKELTKIKTEIKKVTTTKQKTKLITKAKAIIKSLVKLRVLLITYSKTKVATGQRRKIKTIVKTITKQITSTQTLVLELTKTKIKTKVITKPKVKTKVITKPKIKTIVKTKVITKPKVKTDVVPVLKPLLLIPKKTPTKKKKKKVKKGVKEAFVKNPVPSLKAFLG